MATRRPVRLIESVAFETRETDGDDGGGGVHETWKERFCCRAEYTHMRGGETLQAARMEGRHPQIIRVRAADATRAVTTDWRIRDRRTGDIFNIRDIERRTDRLYIDFLAEKGVA